MLIKSSLTIVPFDVHRLLNSDWDFDQETYGSSEGDGVSDFLEVLSDVENMSKEDFFDRFVVPLEGDHLSLAGIERLNTYKGKVLGDPDLGWSLLFEPGCKTLRLLNMKFGVDWLEFPRRTFSHIEHKEPTTFCLYYIPSSTFPWQAGCHPLRVPLQTPWYNECVVGFAK